MGMAVLAMFLFYGTLEPGAMVAQQGAWPWQWGVFGIPHFIAFVLFLTAAIAETKRTPFDIPEGEPEIIGYFVEYSGLRFGMFFLGEFLEIVFSSALMITIFFGGWHVPFEASLSSNAAELALRAGDLRLLAGQGLRLRGLPAGHPLVAAAVPVGPADAARVAAAVAGVHRQRAHRAGWILNSMK